jgi:hypothetical protein
MSCRVFDLLRWCRKAALEMVDLGSRMRDGVIGIGPRETDLQRGQQHAIQHHRLQVRPLNPGVPQAPANLEAFDPVAVMVALHLVAPLFLGAGKHEPIKINVKPFTSPAFFEARAA